ncbi:MAG: DUF3137 domain-containing protein [Robiginitomaculum sp.]|nr:DUF3137 domain-containing protein [Robiginitomaculum sp.]
MSKPKAKFPEGFEAFVAEEIQPLFDAFKAAKSNSLKLIIKFGIIGGLAGAVAGFILFMVKPGIWPASVALFFVCAGIGLIPGYVKLSKAKGKFSQNHISNVAKFLQLDHQLTGFEPIQFENFVELGLIARGDRRSFSNLVSGTHAGTDFSIYHANIEEKRTRITTDSKGNTRTETYWVTVFNGKLLHSPYPRKFACTTIIARDQGWFNSKGRFGKSLKPMGLASPKFEKLFEVYTSDQVEGRFLVDPTFMVRLMELEDNNKDRQTIAAFFEQGIFVALQGGQEYFGNLNDKATASSLATQTVTAFLRVFDFLDALKGDKK